MDRTNSRGLWRYANEFHEAGIAVVTVKGRASTPAYYLVCHALELALKAFLRGKGLSIAELSNKKLGHNLSAILKRAELQGLSQYFSVSAGLRECIDLMNPYYSTKGLEYMTTGCKEYPEFNQLSSEVEKIISGIEDFCVANMKYHEGKSTAIL